MKKILALLLALALVVSLAACGAKKEETPAETQTGPKVTDNADEVADNMTSSDGKYEVAFVTDVGQLKDKSFNQGTYDGVKLYAANNGLSYKYYQPANGDQATDDDRYDAMKSACENGAKVIVAAGFMQGGALERAAKDFPDTKFVFIDGWPLTDGENGPVLENVAPIAYKEEQAGYFAGYAVVMDGYTKLGFCGGGGGDNPACCRYGYGFVQGAEAAAAVKNVNVEINYSWQYGQSFSASPELQTMAAGWYEVGTEIIFACGGSMFSSITAAASANEKKVVGVDVDQSAESNTVVTSAMKGLSTSVVWAISKFYEDKWAEIGGIATSLGVNDDAVGIPTESWSLTGWTVDEYNALYAQVKDGTVVVDANYPADMSTFAGEHVTVTVK